MRLIIIILFLIVSPISQAQISEGGYPRMPVKTKMAVVNILDMQIVSNDILTENTPVRPRRGRPACLPFTLPRRRPTGYRAAGLFHRADTQVCPYVVLNGFGSSVQNHNHETICRGGETIGPAAFLLPSIHKLSLYQDTRDDRPVAPTPTIWRRNGKGARRAPLPNDKPWRV